MIIDEAESLRERSLEIPYGKVHVGTRFKWGNLIAMLKEPKEQMEGGEKKRRRGMRVGRSEGSWKPVTLDYK